MARGRRRKAGARYPCGRLRPVIDRGNTRVQAHQEAFRAFGRTGDDLDCAIGQAHAAGLLDGLPVDGRVLMEHGREWHRLHKAVFGGGVRTTAFERLDRTTGAAADGALDRRFRAWSRIVESLAPEERRILRLVCIEHGEGWALPPFLERLVNGWKARQRPPAYDGTNLPLAEDRVKLERLRRALLGLAGGPAAARRERLSCSAGSG